MIQLTFNNKELKENLTAEELPSLMIDLIKFNTKDKEWATRLSGSHLKFTLNCFDKDGKKLGELSEDMYIFVPVDFVHPVLYYHHLPVVFNIRKTFINKDLCAYFQVDIEPQNIILDDNESLEVYTHIIEHTSYQIMCRGEIISTVLIEKNNPYFEYDKTAIVIPVTTIEHSEHDKELQFNKHQYEFYNDIDDNLILDDVITKYGLKCQEATISKYKF